MVAKRQADCVMLFLDGSLGLGEKARKSIFRDFCPAPAPGFSARGRISDGMKSCSNRRWANRNK
jgi:hypothetical protein